MAHFDRRNDAKLVTALAGGASIRGASRQTGISERTIYRRLESAEFCQQVVEARKKMIERATATLVGGSTKAARKLVKLLEADNPSIQRLAAKDILELRLKIVQVEEIEKRLAEVEAALRAKGVGYGQQF
jgi:molybdenum-dependent DNA-binding transcriptional regulator ModE